MNPLLMLIWLKTFAARFWRERAWWLWLGAGWLVVSACAAPLAVAARQLDYQLKAGYLYNFAKSVDWPPPPLATEAAFQIGVLADETAYGVISEALRDRKIGDHPVKVVLLGLTDDPSSCRVLFVPHTVSLTPAEFRARQPNAPVLLVGEKEGFAAAGGEIGFVPRGDNLRYQVNLSAAQHAGLKLSARLANLAEVVRAPLP